MVFLYLLSCFGFLCNHHGVIDNRLFTEATNGVFRNYAHVNKKKMKTVTNNDHTLLNNQVDDSSISCTMYTENSQQLEHIEEEEEEDN